MKHADIDELNKAGLQIWIVAFVKCRMCGHECVSVYPKDIVDDCMLECPNCEHMTCEPVSYGEPEEQELI